jgi:predicted ester cyclase
MATAIQEVNKGIVQRWIDEVFNAGHLPSVDELKVSSYLDWTPLPSPYQQMDLPVSGIKAALPEWLEALPDFQFSADRMTAEGDFVVCLGHWTAHHQGEYKGLAPTSKRLGGTRIDIFRVAGDKMVEHWGCGNELAFQQMIGAMASDERGAVADEEIASQFVERILNRRDLVAAAELLDPHAVDHSGQAVTMLALLGGFPDLEVTVDDARRDGDRVVVTSTLSGTHRGRYNDVEPTGRRVSATRTDTFRVDAGKIVECWSELDEAELERQLTA